MRVYLCGARNKKGTDTCGDDGMYNHSRTLLSAEHVFSRNYELVEISQEKIKNFSIVSVNICPSKIIVIGLYSTQIQYICSV